MNPSNPKPNIPNSVSADTKGSRYSHVGLSDRNPILNFHNLAVGKLGRTMMFPAKLKSLFSLVLIVVVPVSDKKMLRVYAKSIVAFVEDAIVALKTPVMDFPRDSMPQCVTEALFHIKLSVSRGSSGGPNPTISQFWAMLGNWAALINSLPKSFFGRFEHLLSNVKLHREPILTFNFQGVNNYAV